MLMNQSMKSPTNSSITCATETNPLTIKANKGQVIKISVTNFVHVDVPTICDANGAFGYVNDVYNSTNPKVFICKAVRESVILTSTGEAVELVITKSGHFILSFQGLFEFQMLALLQFPQAIENLGFNVHGSKLLSRHWNELNNYVHCWSLKFLIVPPKWWNW